MIRGPWLMNFIYKKMKNVYTKTSIKFSRSKTSIFLCIENCNFFCMGGTVSPLHVNPNFSIELQRKPQEKILTTKER